MVFLYFRKIRRTSHSAALAKQFKKRYEILKDIAVKIKEVYLPFLVLSVGTILYNRLCQVDFEHYVRSTSIERRLAQLLDSICSSLDTNIDLA